MKTVKEMSINSKKVLIRCDFNVPMKDNKIIDDTRIIESLETIKYVIEQNAKVILFSHLGRVKSEEDLKTNSLKQVAKRLSELLQKDVVFIPKTRGEELESAVHNLKNKDILLVENTRFEDLDGKLESNNDLELGKYWASLGDVFINDAFGTIHRCHASNVGIASNLPHAIGFLVEKELNALNELKKPKKPFIVILGGSKVKDKVGVIKELVKKADHILIGGGMAFTFLLSEGFEVGNSLIDNENIDFCREILEEYPTKILLPIDFLTSKEFVDSNHYKVKEINQIEDGEMGLDIGPKTVELYKTYLKDAKIVLWNGPLGVYEFEQYKKSTEDILKYLIDCNIKTILGGGDIVAAASNAKLKDKVYHSSTGGGATLEFLEGKTLPGIEAMK